MCVCVCVCECVYVCVLGEGSHTDTPIKGIVCAVKIGNVFLRPSQLLSG